MAKQTRPNIRETWRKVQETQRRLEKTVHRVEAEVQRAERNSDSVHQQAKKTRFGVIRTEQNVGVRPKRGKA